MGAVFNIILPTSWSELTDKQLLTVFSLFASDRTTSEVKTLCLMKWNRLEVLNEHPKHHFLICQRNRKKNHPPRGIRGGLFILTSRQIQTATAMLDFLDTIPASPVRLAKIGRHRALPADFEGVPFEKYLYLENLFQGVLHTQKDVAFTAMLSQSQSLLLQMSQILYDSDSLTPSPAHLVNTFYWFASLKQYFSRLFPHFFQPLNDQANNQFANQSLFDQLRDSTNAQIRALTGGDVTKEEAIKKMDTHRALTELDAKAREAEEYRKISQSTKP